MITVTTNETSFWQRLSGRAAFFAALSLVVVFAGAYLFLVNRTVMNIVARERMQREIATASASLSELEFSYMTAKNSVTLEKAHSIGFVDASPSTFLSRSSSTQKPAALSYSR